MQLFNGNRALAKFYLAKMERFEKFTGQAIGAESFLEMLLVDFQETPDDIIQSRVQ